MPYQVKLDVFEGPIDLLLQLITRQRVDIYDVSLATITDEYLGVLAQAEDLDLETATAFLVVAATLLELKSARLLPSERSEEDGRLLEERDRLLARLVECATFRAAGEWLSVGLAEGERWHPRTAGLEPQFANLAPDPLEAASLDDVLAAAAVVFASAPDPQLDVSHIAPIRASVREAILDVAGRLREVGEVTFEELCGHRMARIDVVVRFLALLELFKAGAVDLVQAGRFGDIRASWVGEAEAGEVSALADEYSIAPEEVA